ncbi:MAG: hypothetical protein JSS98_18450 [Bacteroidetes bacterium]|nr:hypothetical protein [Bacteroidota bacterium]
MQSAEIVRHDGAKPIISYKTARAVNDYKNRERGYAKLDKKIKTGKIIKEHLNNKGYNKYLKIEGDANISIDKEKYMKTRNVAVSKTAEPIPACPKRR